MEKELFALLRLGLGNTGLEKENLSNFIVFPTAQWAMIGEIAHQQGVLGVMLDGVDRLESFGCGATRELSKEQKLEWIGNVLNGYEIRNQHQLAVITDLQQRWADVGLRMLVMKGQAMGTYYPNPKHRAPGDIDCYLFDGYAKGNEKAREWADNVDEGWYKHSVISYKGETIENHQYFVHTREGKVSKQLNQQLCNTLDGVNFNVLCGTGALLPPPMFNALFLTYHALTHFLEEGLRLKQLLDWAMFLKREAKNIDWPLFYSWCDKYHFRRFVDVTTDIAVHHLGVTLTDPQIVCRSPFTEKVLRSTIYDEDYVFNNTQGGWNNRWHIIKNLIKYRWKYHQIYQHSLIRQVWFYITGFLFKTER